MSTHRSRVTEEQWLAQKGFIKRKYLVEDASLQDLIGTLASQGLIVTKAQLEYRLRVWKLSKNLKPRTWKTIAWKVEQRARRGKESEVIYNGRRMSSSKVIKETTRHRETLYDELVIRQRSPSPASPRLVVCTPLPIESTTIWPETLPWLRFQSVYNHLSPNIFDQATFRNSQLDITLSALSQGLESYRGSYQDAYFSGLVVTLAGRMPEWYPGEYLQTANVLCAGSCNDKLSEFFKLMVYMGSNNFFPKERDQWDKLAYIIGNVIANSGVDLKQLRSQSNTMRAFLDRLFIQEIFMATEPNYSPGRGTYIPARPLGIIKMLLNSGQDPDKVIGQWADSPSDFITPIGRAISAGHVDLARLLLDSNVRVDNMQMEIDRCHVIQVVLNGRFSSKSVQLRLLKLLHDYQRIRPDEVLCGAVQLCCGNLISELLRGGVDVTKTHREQLRDDTPYSVRPINNCLQFESPITRCLGTDDNITKLILDHPSITKHPGYLTSDGLFIITAIRGSEDTMKHLVSLRPSGLTCKWKGITPFQAAVAYDNMSVTQLCLELGAAPTGDLILIASWCGHKDVLCLLLQHNASPDVLVSWSNLECLTQFGYNGSLSPCLRPIALLLGENLSMDRARLKCLGILLEAGAQMAGAKISKLVTHKSVDLLKAALSAGGDPDDRDKFSRTAIQICISTEKDEEFSKPADPEGFDETHRIVQILLDFGARLVGSEVIKSIQNCDDHLTLLLLQNGGTLMDLDDRGTSCLEALIMSDDANVKGATHGDYQRDFLKALTIAQDFPIDAGPFCAAIQKKDWDIVACLLKRPHKATKCHVLEGTALGLAAKSGQLSILKNLLSRFRHPLALQSGTMPFSVESGTFCVRRRDVYSGQDVLSSLVSHSRDFWRVSSNATSSPLTLAAMGEDTTGFEELLRQGCRADGTTISILTEKSISPVYLSLLRYYCGHFGDLIALSEGRLPSVLVCPIAWGDSERLRFLVEADLSVNDHDVTIRGNRSPLQFAVELGHSNITHYLLERGADVNAPPSVVGGATTLQFAAIGGYVGYARLLLDHGARINARGSRIFGRTALEGAAEHGRLDMLEFLLQNGAAWSGYGRHQFVSAVRFATVEGHFDCVDWLKENYGWVEEDEKLSKHCVDDELERWDTQDRSCISLCCDEIHGSDMECIHHYDKDIEERIESGEFHFESV